MSFYLEPPKINPTYIGRLEGERTWLLNKIEQVKLTKLPRRPGAISEIRALEYQVRRNELELTFCGPEWAKYEKYGIWDTLTS
jgi:hypothetical protein